MVASEPPEESCSTCRCSLSGLGVAGGPTHPSQLALSDGSSCLVTLNDSGLRLALNFEATPGEGEAPMCTCVAPSCIDGFAHRCLHSPLLGLFCPLSQLLLPIQ